ncbi:hypothetical protein N7520_004109 [Penicillium odoratum]|uniref:uncharacterized protein n=1 Tax=Penicillium odoratum TaxID=1167516 RepID=UPI002548F49D|nr:uncharacterized protein N7520_004109 [Penicillium odoratum]KAJ5769550.1 hypothetical protein N7520_004109 [Penicillium odoratum]
MEVDEAVFEEHPRVISGERNEDVHRAEEGPSHSPTEQNRTFELPIRGYPQVRPRVDPSLVILADPIMAPATEAVTEEASALAKSNISGESPYESRQTTTEAHGSSTPECLSSPPTTTSPEEESQSPTREDDDMQN